MEQSVYILKPVLDDPRFEGLQFARLYPSITGGEYLFRDFLPRLREGKYVIGALSELWPSDIHVKGGVRSFNDYPGINLGKPAFSEKAVKCLKPLLVKNGELLPVRHPLGQFYVYNLRRMSNALKLSQSQIEIDPTGLPERVKWYNFFKNRIEEESIFRIAQCPWAVHVTEDFRQRVIACGLNGFHFIKVWPLPEGEDWRDLEAEARKKRGKAHKLVGETLILRFRLNGDEPSAKEKKSIKKIEKELEAIITSQENVDDKLYGSIDASETVKGEHRIFLSCPSVDDLHEYLADWINSIHWDGEFHVVKRWGHLMDTKAKEKRFAIS